MLELKVYVCYDSEETLGDIEERVLKIVSTKKQADQWVKEQIRISYDDTVSILEKVIVPSYKEFEVH